MELSVKVAEYIAAKNLLCPGQKVVLAISGGPDSMAMLHLFCFCLKKQMNLDLVAAHLNHKLRANDSVKDERFVKDQCSHMGLKCVTRSVRVRSMLKPGQSLESLSRQLRYDFLGEVAKETEAHAIVTGHTATDQAETVLLRMLQGTGLKGLQGILPCRNDCVVRPLLCVSRQEIMVYVQKHTVAFRSDASNQDRRFLRNRIRHDVLPCLNRVDLDTETDLLAIANQAQLLWDRRGKYIQDVVNAAFAPMPNQAILLDTHHTEACSDAVLHAFANRVSDRPGRSHVRALRQLLSKPCGKCIQLPGGTEAWKTKQGILAVRAEPKNGWRETVAHIGQNVQVGEKIACSQIQTQVPSRFPGDSDLVAYFDADQIGATWRFRYWKHGDSLVPLGQLGKKKISDLLRERAVPYPLRRNVIVMETEQGISWVVGHRIGELFKVGSDTGHVLKVYFKCKGES